MQKEFNIVLRIDARRGSENLVRELEAELLQESNVISARAEKIELAGVKSSEILVSVTLGFAASIAANFATDAIKEALIRSGRQDGIEIVTCVPLGDQQSTQPGLPRVGTKE